MLIDQIRQDQIQAQKDRKEIELATLRFLNAEIHNLEIDKHAPLTDAEIIQVIQRQIKKRHEAIALYRQGRREELAQKEEAEVQVLNKYIPRQLSQEEIIEVARKIIETSGGKDKVNFGQVMGQVMKSVAGRADGNLVSQVVHSLLS